MELVNITGHLNSTISKLYLMSTKNQASVGDCTLFARTNRTLEMGYIKRCKASFNKNKKN